MRTPDDLTYRERVDARLATYHPRDLGDDNSALRGRRDAARTMSPFVRRARGRAADFRPHRLHRHNQARIVGRSAARRPVITEHRICVECGEEEAAVPWTGQHKYGPTSHPFAPVMTATQQQYLATAKFHERMALLFDKYGRTADAESAREAAATAYSAAKAMQS
jgi:hypothetical protein